VSTIVCGRNPTLLRQGESSVIVSHNEIHFYYRSKRFQQPDFAIIVKWKNSSIAHAGFELFNQKAPDLAAFSREAPIN